MTLVHLHCEIDGLLVAVIGDVSVSKGTMDNVNHVVDQVELHTDLGSHSARFDYKGFVGLVLRSQSSRTTIELHQSLVERQAALLDIEGRRGSRLLHWRNFVGWLFDSLSLKGRHLGEFLSFFDGILLDFDALFGGGPFSFGVCSCGPLSFLCLRIFDLLGLLLQVFFTLFDLVADLLVESTPFALVGSVVAAVTEFPVVAYLFEFVDAPLSDEFFVEGPRRLVSVLLNDIFHNFEHLSALFLVGSCHHEIVKLYFSDHEGLERKREC